MPVPKEENEKLQKLVAGYELLCNYSRMIALLPIDEWLEELEHAETVSAILDPTLYRDYIYSDKAKVLKKIMQAALELKRAVEEAQPVVLREMNR